MAAPFALVDEPWFEAWVIRDYDGHTVPEVPGIKFEGKNSRSVKARIVPEIKELGKKVNIWFGAKSKDGQLFTRNPLPLERAFSPTNVDRSGGSDKWTPYDGKTLEPCLTGYVLEEDNPLHVVQWLNLDDHKGAELFVAYGQTPLDWKMAKVCTI